MKKELEESKTVTLEDFREDLHDTLKLLLPDDAEITRIMANFETVIEDARGDSYEAGYDNGYHSGYAFCQLVRDL